MLELTNITVPSDNRNIIWLDYSICQINPISRLWFNKLNNYLFIFFNWYNSIIVGSVSRVRPIKRKNWCWKSFPFSFNDKELFLEEKWINIFLIFQ